MKARAPLFGSPVLASIYSTFHGPVYKRLIQHRRTHLSQELAERLQKEETLRGKQDAKARKDKEYEQRFRKELGK